MLINAYVFSPKSITNSMNSHLILSLFGIILDIFIDVLVVVVIHYDSLLK